MAATPTTRFAPWLPALLAALVAAQALPAQQQPGKGEPAVEAGLSETPDVKELSDAEARAAVKAFKKQTPRKAKMAQRLRAVQELAQFKHKSLVKPLARLIQQETAVSVAKVAVQALGNQPAKQARPAILKLLEHERVKRKPALVGALIESLARAGYVSRTDWKKIDDLFERKFEQEYVPVQKAILKLVAETKEKQAVSLLLAHMDEPAPVNVDDPSNPPASYWEARWKAWRAWRADVKEALYQITGQRFSKSEEARAWLRKNGRKIGIK